MNPFLPSMLRAGIAAKGARSLANMAAARLPR